MKSSKVKIQIKKHLRNIAEEILIAVKSWESREDFTRRLYGLAPRHSRVNA